MLLVFCIHPSTLQSLHYSGMLISLRIMIVLVKIVLKSGHERKGGNVQSSLLSVLKFMVQINTQ
jgi:hypothetical protein